MSYHFTAQLADSVEHDEMPIEAAVLTHLTTNMFPAQGYMCNPALEAIEAMVDGEPERLIVLPNGNDYPADYIVDELKLEPFVEAVIGRLEAV